MTEEERAQQALKWDARSPVERLLSLSRQEQTAFMALFRGAYGNLQGSYRADTDTLIPIKFGKAECEWPSFNLWRFKLPGLRLTTYQEGQRRVALGMPAGSAVWDITISATEDGVSAYENYWDALKETTNGIT